MLVLSSAVRLDAGGATDERRRIGLLPLGRTSVISTILPLSSVSVARWYIFGVLGCKTTLNG